MDGRPPGNTGCCRLFASLSFRRRRRRRPLQRSSPPAPAPPAPTAPPAPPRGAVVRRGQPVARARRRPHPSPRTSEPQPPPLPAAGPGSLRRAWPTARWLACRPALTCPLAPRTAAPLLRPGPKARPFGRMDGRILAPADGQADGRSAAGRLLEPGPLHTTHFLGPPDPGNKTGGAWAGQEPSRQSRGAAPPRGGKNPCPQVERKSNGDKASRLVPMRTLQPERAPTSPHCLGGGASPGLRGTWRGRHPSGSGILTPWLQVLGPSPVPASAWTPPHLSSLPAPPPPPTPVPPSPATPLPPPP